MNIKKIFEYSEEHDDMNLITKEIQWCISQHENTNHMYDTYLPYEFHLRMVAKTASDFYHLAEQRESIISSVPYVNAKLSYTLQMAAFGHDLIEDCRVTYNDCAQNLGIPVADIIYAVTNEKGKNRAERGNEKYYADIKDTPGATYIKLCDRIANTQYSKMSGSRMFGMYQKEKDKFLERIGDKYPEMSQYLIDILS